MKWTRDVSEVLTPGTCKGTSWRIDENEIADSGSA